MLASQTVSVCVTHCDVIQGKLCSLIHGKLQSNRHHQQTNIHLCPTNTVRALKGIDNRQLTDTKHREMIVITLPVSAATAMYLVDGA